MSQALAVITENRPAQTFRVGYDMPARQFQSGADVLAHSRAVHAKFRPQPAPVMRLRRSEAVVVEAVEEEPCPDGAPVNMLACQSWRFLLALVGAKHGIAPKEILSKRRKTEIVAARYEAMALVYLHTQASYPQVAEFFGRDHSTVVNALQQLGMTRKLVERRPDMMAVARSKMEMSPLGRKPSIKVAPHLLLQKSIKAAHDAGTSFEDVAYKHNTTIRKVNRVAVQMGLIKPSSTKSKDDWKVRV